MQHALATAYDRWAEKYGDKAARNLFLLHSVSAVVGFWLNWILKQLTFWRSSQKS